MTQHWTTQLKRLFFATALGTMCLIQIGCAKDQSKTISISIVPSRPVVINADYELYDTANSALGAPVYIDIKAPWIKFGYSLVNTNADDATDNTVTIMAINLTYSGFDMYGNSLFGTGSVTESAVAGAPQTITYPYLALVPPGGKITAGNGLGAGGTFDPTLNYSGDFYMGGLPITPPPTTGTTTPSTFVPTYSIQATFIGWFGTFDNPQKRFQKTITFVTQ